jgi:hypothetical protein
MTILGRNNNTDEFLSYAVVVAVVLILAVGLIGFFVEGHRANKCEAKGGQYVSTRGGGYVCAKLELVK